MLAQPLQTLANLFLQQNCPFCDRPAPVDMCPHCWRQLQSCAHHQPAIPTDKALPVLSWGHYQGMLKQAIRLLKYNGNIQIASSLGDLTGQHWRRFPITTRRAPLVVPIPLHPDKLKQRGFNQAELLATAFCEQTGLKLTSRGLVRRRATLPQFELGIAERQKNLAGAFEVNQAWQRRPPQSPVLLLDDIYTTGTTVRTAAAELRRRGISVCGVVAIARAVLDS